MPKVEGAEGGEIFLKKVKLKRVYPENLRSHFVQNLIIQHEPGVFILSFFETWPPVVIGESDEEKKHLLESIDEVESKCVARLVLTPDKLFAFIKAMEKNLSLYEKRFQTQILNLEE
jgi:hypothetical protein